MVQRQFDKIHELTKEGKTQLTLIGVTHPGVTIYKRASDIETDTGDIRLSQLLVSPVQDALCQ
jgi:hypothetical protein